MFATFAVAVAKRRPKKIQACTGFDFMTSAIPMQRSDSELVISSVRNKPVEDEDEIISYIRTAE